MHAMDHGFEEAKAHPEAQDGVPAGQDLRHMGGLLARQGIAGWTLIVGGLSLAGLFPLAGFFSKDEILHAVLTHPRDGGPWLGLAWIGMLTAALTAFYTGRLLILALAGRPRSRGAERAATFRLPLTMAVPLVLLAGLVIIGGALGLDLAGRIALVSRLLGAAGHETLGKQGPTALSVALLATAMALAGLAAAWLVYRPGRPAPTLGGGYRATAAGLARQGFYVDALYDRLFVRPYRQAASLLWLVVDDRVIDGVVNGVGRSILACGQLSRRAQTGLVRQYALSILLGVIVIVAFLLLRAP